MTRESRTNRVRRAGTIAAVLRRTYPEAHCELVHTTPLELLVATILSAQCSDRQVNQVTASLFLKYKRAEDYATASQEQLETDLRRIGLFRNKARSLRLCCRALVERHGGQVPDSMDALTALAGVGRKTANVVLGTAFGRNEGVVVDTHVGRLAQRLGLSTQKEPVRIESDLMRVLPRDQWTQFSHDLIWHGRRRCSARRPDCAGCELRTCCPSAGGFLTQD